MARKPRNLSKEEKELWSRVADTAQPLHKPFEIKPDKAIQPGPVKKDTPNKKPPVPEFEIGSRSRQASRTRIDLKPSIEAEVGSNAVSMDKKAFKKLSRGKLTPEARLDLHGMTLAQAQPALTRFVMTSQAKGMRLVLVITGKGKSGGDEFGPIPYRKGVLKDQVPRWLASAPLKPIVLQVAQAHGSHGGAGAYYVYLRKARK